MADLINTNVGNVDTQEQAVNQQTTVNSTAGNVTDTSTSSFDTATKRRVDDLLKSARLSAPQEATTNKDYYPSQQGINISQGVIAPIYTTGDIQLPFALADKVKANRQARDLAEMEAMKVAQPEISPLDNPFNNEVIQKGFVDWNNKILSETANQLREKGINENLAPLYAANNPQVQDQIKKFNFYSAKDNQINKYAKDVYENPQRYSEDARKMAERYYRGLDAIVEGDLASANKNLDEVKDYFQKFETIPTVIKAIKDNEQARIRTEFEQMNNLSTGSNRAVALKTFKGNYFTSDNKGNIILDENKVLQHAQNIYNSNYSADPKKAPSFNDFYQQYKNSITDEISSKLETIGQSDYAFEGYKSGLKKKEAEININPQSNLGGDFYTDKGKQREVFSKVWTINEADQKTFNPRAGLIITKPNGTVYKTTGEEEMYVTNAMSRKDGTTVSMVRVVTPQKDTNGDYLTDDKGKTLTTTIQGQTPSSEVVEPLANAGINLVGLNIGKTAAQRGGTKTTQTPKVKITFDEWKKSNPNGTFSEWKQIK